MQIGFIGAGKVGTALGKYFLQNGYQITGYHSRSQGSLERAVELTKSRVLSLEDLIKASDLIWITTNDDEIPQVCQELVKVSPENTQKILVHVSGALTSQVLAPAQEKGYYTYSVHPLQSFAELHKSIEDLKETVFSIEGDYEKIAIIEDIFKNTGNKYFKLKPEQKSIYHAASCVVSNYLVTLMDYGLSLLEITGVEKDEGYKMLFPLVTGTLTNIAQVGTKAALTGPITRGDIETIQEHLQSLTAYAPDKQDFYRRMGLETLELVKKRNDLDQDNMDKLQKLLIGGIANGS